MLDALAYMKAARAQKVSAALEVSQSGRGAHVWIFFAQATSAATARSVATSLLGEAFQLRGSMHLSSYDRLFPSQDVHTGRGMGNLIAAPLNGKRRQHGTTLFLDPATLEPFDDQWAYLSSIPRLSHKDVIALVRTLPDPQFGHHVRRLQLPSSSKIVPRPAAIIRATFASRLTLTANDLGPAMIAAVKHAASIRNPEFDARQRARRSTWDTPRFLYSYDETAEGDLVLPRGLYGLLTELVDSAGKYVAHRRQARHWRPSRIHLLSPAPAGTGRRRATPRRGRHRRRDRTSWLGQDGDCLRRNRFSHQLNPCPRRPQSTGGPMA